jgi:hypothetical protein
LNLAVVALLSLLLLQCSAVAPIARHQNILLVHVCC